MIDKLTGDFEMLFDFKSICTKLPKFSYAENVELNVMVKEMISLDLPTTDQWKLVDNYGKIKYKIHQYESSAATSGSIGVIFDRF